MEKYIPESEIAEFSSPFIEERLYFKQGFIIGSIPISVLVPFYRGAVVFSNLEYIDRMHDLVLVPFYRGAVVFPFIVLMMFDTVFLAASTGFVIASLTPFQILDTVSFNPLNTLLTTF